MGDAKRRWDSICRDDATLVAVLRSVLPKEELTSTFRNGSGVSEVLRGICVTGYVKLGNFSRNLCPN